MSQTPETPTEPTGWTPRAIAWLVVRIAVAVGVLAFALSRAPWDELTASLARLDLAHFAVAVVLLACTNFVGGLRWRFALVAFGATRLPPLTEQIRLYFVGHFYNTYVPGGLGGDVLRAGLTQRAVGSATAAWASVFTERLLGLAALFTWLALALLTGVEIEGVGTGLFLGIAAVMVTVALSAPLVLRLFKKRWGLGELRALPLVATYLVSLLAHALVAFSGHAIISGIVPDARISHSMVVVPMAQAATFFPATVGGLGVREAAWVELFTRLGVSPADAGAAAFAFLGVTLLAAGFGGLVHIAVPSFDVEPQPEADA